MGIAFAMDSSMSSHSESADEPFRPVPHGVGELQFPAGCRPDRADALAVGALVGRVEFSDGVDLVTEELDAHRMWRGWGKDVDDAAAHRELATVHHQVDARVGVLNQSARHVVERQLLALREDERIDVAEPLDTGWISERTGMTSMRMVRTSDWCRWGA